MIKDLKQMKSNKYIDKMDFYKIIRGDILKIRYLLGIAEVAEKPYYSDIKVGGNSLNVQKVKVVFKDGPWKDEHLTIIRNQVEKVN